MRSAIGRRGSDCGREQPQRLWQSTERVAAAAKELKAGAGDEITDRVGDEYFVWGGKVSDLRGPMYCYTSGFTMTDLDLPGMKAATHFDPKWSQFLKIAAAQRTARAGPSKVATKPPPVVWIS